MPAWEEVQYCPICKQKGEQTRKTAGPHRSVIYTFTCKNERCRWFETGWIIQRNEDGSIPERQAGEKEYIKIDTNHGRRVIEALEEELDRPTGPRRQQ